MGDSMRLRWSLDPSDYIIITGCISFISYCCLDSPVSSVTDTEARALVAQTRGQSSENELPYLGVRNMKWNCTAVQPPSLVSDHDYSQEYVVPQDPLMAPSTTCVQLT